MSKETSSANREQAILDVLWSYADLMSWSVAHSTVNGIKWDSVKNGGFWAGAAIREEREFRKRVKSVGGPHVDFVLKHFAHLKDLHISNLKTKEGV